MGQIGLNFPADMRLSPQFGELLGAKWLRVVLKPDVDLTPWIAEAHQRGLSVLGVIARESLAGSYEETAILYVDRYDETLDALQIGNESDHQSDSSWSMTPSDLNDLLAAFNMQFAKHTDIIGPGMVSGDPSYLNAVDLDLVDAIAVHPYGQRPDNIQNWDELPGNFGAVAGLLDSYRYHKKDIWVTEVGVSTTQVSEAFQARYCEAIVRSLKLRTDVPVAMWFCADDEMVEAFGLYRASHPKPAAISFMNAAKPPTEPLNQPKFVLGFKQVAAANPVLVGNPLENEFGFVEGLSLQRTDRPGILFWADTRASGSHMGYIDLRNGDRYRWNPSAGLVKVAA